MSTVLSYGSWPSPVTAQAVAAGSRGLSGARVAGPGNDTWWGELRPAEGGRVAICRQGSDGRVIDVTSAPWNARTRVHEYGGGAWTVTSDGALIFAEFTDQRLYRVDSPNQSPVALTPDCGDRYADLQVIGDEVWCVREQHAPDGIVSRDICAVPLHGGAAADPSQVRRVVRDGHFLAFPRMSPDGRQLAWITWEHPQMPWDGTALKVADLVDGCAVNVRRLAGSTHESILQPEWIDSDSLYAVTDRTGWWNIHRFSVDEATSTPVHAAEAEFAGPLWQLGMQWYAVMPDGRLLVTRCEAGADRLGILDPVTGGLTDIVLPAVAAIELGSMASGEVALLCGGGQLARGVRVLNLATGTLRDVRLALTDLPDDSYLPVAKPMTFTGPEGREVHAVVYPPRHPQCIGPATEAPPYIAWVHGGPTAHVLPRLSLMTAYFTSRGIGIIDVNYGGSTGFGRAYRDRLLGQWGIVDVEDTIAAVRGLADAGLADSDRLAISGGSAGGWTVLSALTNADAFACGSSHYGVADLIGLAEDTHDFESRYLDGLVGPLPEMRALYDERAPINRVDGLSVPVLLLQGLDDPIVPPSQAERFRDALIAKGVPHAYLPFEGESHGFRRAETMIAALEAELSFFGQVMGFTPPDVPVLELWRPSP